MNLFLNTVGKSSHGTKGITTALTNAEFGTSLMLTELPLPMLEFEKGDSMWMISQRYGVKLKKLYKRNKMIAGTSPEPGQQIYLRKNKK